MSEYLAIDPGEHAGWAIMSESLKLTACGINKPPRRPFKVVFYEMQEPRPSDSPAKKKNILTLCVTTGKLVGPFEELGSQLAFATPSGWKGQIPKHIHHPAILHALTPQEQDVVARCGNGIAASWIEDMMDAVGLACYARKMRIFR